jgi:hypothetical protein
MKPGQYLGDFSAIGFVGKLEALSEKIQRYRRHISLGFCSSPLYRPFPWLLFSWVRKLLTGFVRFLSPYR